MGDCARCVKDTIDAFGGIDIIIGNAVRHKPLHRDVIYSLKPTTGLHQIQQLRRPEFSPGGRMGQGD